MLQGHGGDAARFQFIDSRRVGRGQGPARMQGLGFLPSRHVFSEVPWTVSGARKSTVFHHGVLCIMPVKAKFGFRKAYCRYRYRYCLDARPSLVCKEKTHGKKS